MKEKSPTDKRTGEINNIFVNRWKRSRIILSKNKADK